MSIFPRAFVPSLCLLLLAVGLLVIGNRPAHSFPEESRAPAKWEYSTSTVDLGSLAATLNELGPQGWEVFSVDHVVSGLEQPAADGKTRLVVEKLQVTSRRPAK